MRFVPSKCKNRAIHLALAAPFRPIAPLARVRCLWLGTERRVSRHRRPFTTATEVNTTLLVHTPLTQILSRLGPNDHRGAVDRER
jgi:hypothetical protein